MLRPYQQQAKDAVFSAWESGLQNVLLKAPTGAGKTVILADIVRTFDRASAVIAHRSELVSQISCALAREGVRHRIIGSETTRRNCVSLQMDRFKRSFYDPSARVGVCSVDTLAGKNAAHDPWFAQVGLWVQDEAHHVLRNNKWGRAAAMFPNARGLGVTATPARADGQGLGAHADGLFDVMVEGPGLRELIDAGYLTDYKIYTVPTDVDYSSVPITGSGDLSPAKLSAAVHRSRTIVGDVVKHYLRIAPGKLGVTFAVDVAAAQEIAAAYNAAGVPAEVVTAKTPDLLRAEILRRFARREVLQLVNVDLFGEGFDLPAIEVVSMVRRTASWPLYVQQFGRALRLMISPILEGAWDSYTDAQRREIIAQSEKPYAIIIDHVGNVATSESSGGHPLPDAPRVDTLDRRERRSKSAPDVIPLKTCGGCFAVYQRQLKTCPYCDYYTPPASRSAPEFVDGDLVELDAAALAALRGAVAAIDGPPRVPGHLDGIAAAAVKKQHRLRQEAQTALREQIALWAGWQAHQGRTDSETYRLFYINFGLDVLSAQALGRPDAEALTAKITAVLNHNGVIKL